MKCRSTFVRRDLLLRHDRTVHAKDGGIPLHSDVKRRAGPKTSAGPSKSGIAIDSSTLEQIEASSDGMVDLETAAMLMTDLHHKATAAMRTAGVGPYENRPGMAFPHHGAALMEPLITPAAEKKLVGDVAQLKSLIEKGASNGTTSSAF